jgi:hypothetical protein
MHTTATASLPPPSNSTSISPFHLLSSPLPVSISPSPISHPSCSDPQSRLPVSHSADASSPDSLLFAQSPPSSSGRGGPGASLDRKGKSRAVPDMDGGQDFLALDIDGDRGENGAGGRMNGDGNGGYQQMQLMEQQVGPIHLNACPSRWRTAKGERFSIWLRLQRHFAPP